LKNKKIVVVSDHAGFYLKEKILSFLKREKYDIKDFGCFTAEPPVSDGVYDLGISICGTGNGINMVVNKHQGIRSALCWNEEISRLARAHNDANICAIPGRFVSESEAYLIVKTFLNTSFEGGRHKPRIDKISLKMY